MAMMEDGLIKIHRTSVSGPANVLAKLKMPIGTRTLLKTSLCLVVSGAIDETIFPYAIVSVS